MKKFILIISFFIFTNLYSQGFTQLTSKVFKVKYKPIEEIIVLSQGLLSKKGTIRQSEKLDLFVVNDYPENIASIDSLLENYDKPYHQIEITVILAEGFNSEESSEIDEEISPLIQNRYNFNNIVKIDKGIFRCEEKTETVLRMGEGNYIFTILCEYLGGTERSIKFHKISLDKYVIDIQGKIARNIFNTSIELANNNLTLISASRPDSEGKALFLFVKTLVL